MKLWGELNYEAVAANVACTVFDRSKLNYCLFNYSQNAYKKEYKNNPRQIYSGK